MKISKIKSFVFGLAFLGSMGFGGISANAQEMAGPDNGEGDRWVCCQTWEISTCTDRFGWPYNGTEKVYAKFCP